MSRSLRDITVKEFMSASLVSFSPDTDIFAAIKLLVGRGVSGAPVLDQFGNIIGMLSERDCMKVALNAAYHDEFGGRVSDFMTRNPVSVDAAASILEVAEIFFTNPFKRLPVIHQQRLVGQVSRSDVLKAIDRFVQVDLNDA
ncbi:CBS domain-containing protein [Polycyclovorans algicola]|uniref:CBS domain-containing protein n=1 Tax=Polycyclovorans algicola TaxID=616992 RepID=UPI0004A6B9B1|nr:CBS domain-containing protein [Polycyclovorans algicola]